MSIHPSLPALDPESAGSLPVPAQQFPRPSTSSHVRSASLRGRARRREDLVARYREVASLEGPDSVIAQSMKRALSLHLNSYDDPRTGQRYLLIDSKQQLLGGGKKAVRRFLRRLALRRKIGKTVTVTYQPGMAIGQGITLEGDPVSTANVLQLNRNAVEDRPMTGMNVRGSTDADIMIISSEEEKERKKAWMAKASVAGPCFEVCGALDSVDQANVSETEQHVWICHAVKLDTWRTLRDGSLALMPGPIVEEVAKEGGLRRFIDAHGSHFIKGYFRAASFFGSVRIRSQSASAMREFKASLKAHLPLGPIKAGAEIGGSRQQSGASSTCDTAVSWLSSGVSLLSEVGPTLDHLKVAYQTFLAKLNKPAREDQPSPDAPCEVVCVPWIELPSFRNNPSIVRQYQVLAAEYDRAVTGEFIEFIRQRINQHDYFDAAEVFWVAEDRSFIGDLVTSLLAPQRRFSAQLEKLGRFCRAIITLADNPTKGLATAKEIVQLASPNIQQCFAEKPDECLRGIARLTIACTELVKAARLCHLERGGQILKDVRDADRWRQHLHDEGQGGLFRELFATSFKELLALYYRDPVQGAQRILHTPLYLEFFGDLPAVESKPAKQAQRLGKLLQELRSTPELGSYVFERVVTALPHFLTVIGYHLLRAGDKGRRAEGIELLEQAGRRGEVEAQLLLADYYERLSNTVNGRQQAAEWLQLASATGHQPSHKKLQEWYNPTKWSSATDWENFIGGLKTGIRNLSIYSTDLSDKQVQILAPQLYACEKLELCLSKQISRDSWSRIVRSVSDNLLDLRAFWTAIEDSHMEILLPKISECRTFHMMWCEGITKDVWSKVAHALPYELIGFHIGSSDIRDQDVQVLAPKLTKCRWFSIQNCQNVRGSTWLQIIDHLPTNICMFNAGEMLELSSEFMRRLMPKVGNAEVIDFDKAEAVESSVWDILIAGLPPTLHKICLKDVKMSAGQMTRLKETLSPNARISGQPIVS